MTIWFHQKGFYAPAVLSTSWLHQQLNTGWCNLFWSTKSIVHSITWDVAGDIMIIWQIQSVILLCVRHSSTLDMLESRDIEWQILRQLMSPVLNTGTILYFSCFWDSSIFKWHHNQEIQRFTQNRSTSMKNSCVEMLCSGPETQEPDKLLTM